MGSLYSIWEGAFGGRHINEALAVFENGSVYLAVDGLLNTVVAGTKIAEYENGNIYSISNNSRKNLIAGFENGKLYGVYDDVLGVHRSSEVGSFASGVVYSKNQGAIAKYSGNDDEGAAAAAAVLLFQLTSSVSAYSDLSRETLGFGNEEKTKGSSESSTGQSEKNTKRSWPLGVNGTIFLAVFLLMLPGVLFSMITTDLPLMLMMNPSSAVSLLLVVVVIVVLVIRKKRKK